VTKRNAKRKRAERKRSPDALARRAYGAKIKLWLLANGLSQADLARALKVSDFTVSVWVSGAFSPSGTFPEAIETYTGGEVRAEDCLRRSPKVAVSRFVASK